MGTLRMHTMDILRIQETPWIHYRYTTSTHHGYTTDSHHTLTYYRDKQFHGYITNTFTMGALRILTTSWEFACTMDTLRIVITSWAFACTMDTLRTHTTPWELAYELNSPTFTHSIQQPGLQKCIREKSRFQFNQELSECMKAGESDGKISQPGTN
ncbi:hypothetical protein PoB_001565900 [Plakobranchus ocellatus]|uniref:Uncharacterized protein n=1 Tax=Plakobranchus ocellatus TaxID=259542 RepID=A0AAV3Z562_9GAST|nr:hypothetical protein PoB_001565900 [Plakobranchus ocellatus]